MRRALDRRPLRRCALGHALRSVILLAVVLFLGVVTARPSEILDVDIPNLSHEQHGVPGKAVHGEYEALDAFGNWYEVKYIADEKGFRTL
ncbi:hypothetical protein O3P69_011506 [Scylla paramamosain]|uniref:Uncharacterized protein n=1 Tax=Scylla paramamosain TaxID=85552 RepID=A0AAW0T6Z8_SCYPA